MLLEDLKPTHINIRAIALHLQQLLLDQEEKMPGFEVLKLEPLKRAGVLVSVVLHLKPAPVSGKSKAERARIYKRGVSVKPHAIEVYSGPHVSFPSRVYTTSSEPYDTIDHGIFLFYAPDPKKPIAFMATDTGEEAQSAKIYHDLVCYEVGFEDSILTKFVNGYINEWGA